MDDESLENIVAVALQRIRASLERGTPFMAQRVRTWMESLYPNQLSLARNTLDASMTPFHSSSRRGGSKKLCVGNQIHPFNWN